MSVVPTATYRLQLSRAFPLRAARDAVDYLARLGVSHLYSSPLLRARTGSTHGYDVVDPTRLDPELGSEDELATLAAELRARGMGIVLDIVPNHMAASDENPLWDDVLAHGRSSGFAAWFDIDWGEGGDGPVLVPVLGDLDARVLARGELELVWPADRPRVRYFEHSFPLDPATVPQVLGAARPPDDADRAAIDTVLDRLRALPARAARDPNRHAEAEHAFADLAALVNARPGVGEHIAAAVAAFADGALARERLATLLEAQAYRLVHWRRAAGDISYRRFFNVADLVGLRVESGEVFFATHSRVAAWVAADTVQGLRVDHVDGLWDPREYLERLRALADRAAPGHDVPIWVEKILTGDERLREGWPVAGTTGYELIPRLDDLFLDPSGFAAIERWYRRLVRAPAATGFESVARAGKRRLVDTWLAPDVRRLVRVFAPIARNDPRSESIDARELLAAIVEVLVRFPVYRTYLEERADSPDAEDRAAIERAIAGACDVPGIAPAALDVLAETLRAPGSDAARRAFVHRFQQTTAPVVAKGVEDTALYRWVPLVVRNEVGADPGAPLGDAVDALHAANAERARRWPRSLLATTTHDTKRSADVRSRLAVLSEIPERWIAHVGRWRRLNRSYRRRVGQRHVPDANTEYLLYQTLVGIWPSHHDGVDVEPRVRGYMQKAIREAKVHTSWLDPVPEFERAVDEFVAAILRDDAFVADVAALVAHIARPGLWTAIARTLVQLTAPGTPDVYQGDERWNFSLTDPDNRRPVDFAGGRALLADLDARPADPTLARALAERPEDDRAKLHVVRTVLRARRADPSLFAGGYERLAATGPTAAHAFAFRRGHENRVALTIVPRLVYSLSGPAPPIGAAWRDATIPLTADLRDRDLTNVLTNETWRGDPLPLAAVLGAFPVALLLTHPASARTT